MPSRVLPYPVFDADNHFYEPKEALTQFLPDHRRASSTTSTSAARTKIMVRNVVSDYIPNPTFEVVARPGAQEEYFRHGSGGKSFREVMGKPMKAIPAFRDPAARLEVMDGLGLDYTLMFPTLASLVEERLKDDPELILDIVHALNEWMYETWQFNYEGRIFSTPVINLGVVDRALEELEWCLERGARPSLSGLRRCRNARHPFVRHGGVRPVLGRLRQGRHPRIDARLGQRLLRVPQRLGARRRVQAVRADLIPHGRDGKRPIEDTMAALVCHGALTRNPDLRILSIENGADWVPSCSSSSRTSTRRCRKGSWRTRSRRSGVASTLRRSGEDDFAQMAELCGVDR